MPVSSTHKDYDNNRGRWCLLRDCVEGSEAIKQARSASSFGLYSERGTKYLPPPNADDDSQVNQLRYRAYRERALFVNFTAHTKDGLAGMIARKESEKELPPEAEYLLEDATGSGASIDQLEQRAISEVLEVARLGLLVDYPQSEGGTLSQTSGLKACIKCYPTETIINWKEETRNGETKLSLVVLKERVEKQVDDFESEMVNQYRVLRLIDGVYWQLVYNEDEVLQTWATPRKFDGSTWREIPFVIIGSVDNGVSVDKSVLYDIAELNIGHYRNSADFEESCFLVGQPTPIFAGLNKAWVEDVLKTGVSLGSRTGVLLPEGGSGSLLQASENQMPSKGMELKEQQMIKIGAKIITDSGGVETAEAAKIRFAGQSSKLALIVNNVESAIVGCIGWVLDFMGGQGEIKYKINRQFYEATVDPQLLIAQMQLNDRGVIGKSDMRDYLRKTAVIDAMRTDEEIDEEVEQDDPLDGIAPPPQQEFEPGQ